MRGPRPLSAFASTASGSQRTAAGGRRTRTRGPALRRPLPRCATRFRVSGAERGRRSSDPGEVGFDRIKTLGQRQGLDELVGKERMDVEDRINLGCGHIRPAETERCPRMARPSRTAEANMRTAAARPIEACLLDFLEPKGGWSLLVGVELRTLRTHLTERGGRNGPVAARPAKSRISNRSPPRLARNTII